MVKGGQGRDWSAAWSICVFLIVVRHHGDGKSRHRLECSMARLCLLDCRRSQYVVGVMLVSEQKHKSTF